MCDDSFITVKNGDCWAASSAITTPLAETCWFSSVAISETSGVVSCKSLNLFQVVHQLKTEDITVMQTSLTQRLAIISTGLFGCNWWIWIPSMAIYNAADIAQDPLFKKMEHCLLAGIMKSFRPQRAESIWSLLWTITWMMDLFLEDTQLCGNVPFWYRVTDLLQNIPGRRTTLQLWWHHVLLQFSKNCLQ